MKNILIMAAGAIGGYFGGLLSNNNDVVFIARGEHLQATKTRGLLIKSQNSGTFTAKGVFASEVPENYIADLILYCVKEYHNESAAELISPAIGCNTTIMTLQNGIGSADFLSKKFSAANIVIGAAYVEATKANPGVIEEHGGDCLIKFGPYEASKKSNTSINKIHHLLTTAKIQNEIVKNINSVIWEKLIFISALSGMTCITRSEFSEVISNSSTKDMTWRLINESYKIAQASGVNLPKDIPDLIMKNFLQNKNELVSSMHSDLKNGRPIEIKAINGAISNIAKSLNIQAPINETIYNALEIYNQNTRNSLEENRR